MTEAVKPGVGAFDDLTARLLAGFFGLAFFPTGPNMGGVAACGEGCAHRFRVVTRVQAQALLTAPYPVGLAGRLRRRWQADQGAIH